LLRNVKRAFSGALKKVGVFIVYIVYAIFEALKKVGVFIVYIVYA
jgi:hypothetical protein